MFPGGKESVRKRAVHLCTLNYIIHLLWLGFTILGSERKKKSGDPVRNRVHDKGGEWSTLEVGKIDYDDAEEKGGKEKKKQSQHSNSALASLPLYHAQIQRPDTSTLGHLKHGFAKGCGTEGEPETGDQLCQKLLSEVLTMALVGPIINTVSMRIVKGILQTQCFKVRLTVPILGVDNHQSLIINISTTYI